jgi:hypothetical protein
MYATFHKCANGRIAVYDDASSLSAPAIGYLIPVEDDQTGLGRGYVVENDLTQYFYRSKEEAADFLMVAEFRIRTA